MNPIQQIIASIGKTKYPVLIVEKILNDPICTKILFFQNFLDGKCLSLAISKTLGYVTIIGACMYKMPIVMNMIRSKSGNGLDPTSVYLETIAMICMVFYNFQKQNDFSTYGDNISAALQTMVIILLMWAYGIDGKKLGLPHILTVLILSSVFFVALVTLPVEYLNYIAVASSVISTVAKCPQIIRNFKTKAIGVQSWVTTLTALLGVLAKLFINIRETPDDIILIGGTLLLLLLNTTLLIQSLIYKKDATVKTQEKVHINKKD